MSRAGFGYCRGLVLPVGLGRAAGPDRFDPASGFLVVCEASLPTRSGPCVRKGLGVWLVLPIASFAPVVSHDGRER